jgi:aspartate aminotransferase-like enzyme
MNDIVYKKASEPIEFKQIHELNYHTFVEEIPQHEPNLEQCLIDKFNQQNIYFIAKKHGEVIGMISIRGLRPFSLDKKINNLDDYIPPQAKPCEIRLLSIKKEYRKSFIFYMLCTKIIEYCMEENYTLVLISGVESQVSLYKKIGFQSFGNWVGDEKVRFQPMLLSHEQFAHVIYRFGSWSKYKQQDSSSHNFLPGPVSVHPHVTQAFNEKSISHRCQSFISTLKDIQKKLCQETQAAHVQIALGTGTLANDFVAAQIKKWNSTGLILANGEFGMRLIDHAKRFSISFHSIVKEWNDSISVEEIEQYIKQHREIRWLWHVHCETSTGYVYDLDHIQKVCARYNVAICLDACSSIGVIPLSLDKIHLASTVSGKGLGSYPGLAIVFHKEHISPTPSIPRYLDLGLYADTPSTPFTHSSNLVHALGTALNHINTAQIRQYAKILRARLAEMDYKVLGDELYSPGILTICLPKNQSSQMFGDRFKEQGILLSYESHYLLKRNWVQISLMGYHTLYSIASLIFAFQNYNP